MKSKSYCVPLTFWDIDILGNDLLGELTFWVMNILVVDIMVLIRSYNYVCIVCVIVMTHIKDTARDVNSLDMHTPTSVL